MRQTLLMEENLISLSYLHQLSSGDKRFEREMLQLYLDKTPNDFVQLETAVNDGNFELIRFTSHKLRPSFNLMGIKENGLLQYLEDNASSSQEMDPISKNFNLLKSIYEKSVISVQEELKKIKEKV